MANSVTRMGAGGRVVIPAEYRKKMGVKPGDRLIVTWKNGELRLFTVQQGIARAQAIVRKYIPANRNLAAELLAERREEVRREEGKRG